jgi:hypothetical protein
MDLSIIIVNWNSINYLRVCIASILQHTRGIAFEVVVVDNASPAGDADIIEREFKDIVFIRSPKNLGFAGANNCGFRRSTGDCVLFLNPDTELLGPAINRMFEKVKALPDCGIMGCKLLNSDHSVQTSSIQKFPTISNQLFQSEVLRLRWPGFPLWNIGPLFSSSPQPARVEAITGACMMMRRKVFEEVGLYSEDYWMYSEDLDLCFKVQRAGFRNYYTGEATILHHAGKSSNPGWAMKMKLRSDLRFLTISRGRFYTLAFRTAMVFNALARMAVIAILYPFGRLAGRQKGLEQTWAKWRMILGILWSGFADQQATGVPGKSVTDCVTRS